MRDKFNVKFPQSILPNKSLVSCWLDSFDGTSTLFGLFYTKVTYIRDKNITSQSFQTAKHFIFLF